MDHFDRERTGDHPMKWTCPWMAASLLLVGPGAQAQLLPGGGIGQAGRIVPGVVDRLEQGVEGASLDRLSPARLVRQLAAARTARIDALLRKHGDRVELDDRREPARRGVILLTGATDASLASLRAAGYDVASEEVEGIDLPILRVTVPRGRNLAKALRDVRAIAPEAQASADNLYFASGRAAAGGSAPLAARPVDAKMAGLIDGGVARHPSLTGGVEQRGFAEGAPRASAHGTAVASLISGNGAVRGAAPGISLLVGDVYGSDPAGGGAFAIVRALGWMTARGVRVVTISLVGPANPLLEGAIALAREKGVTIVAAVGNDGPAAPPAYPASYPDVLAVTGIDGRGRVLPEAGRALHVDFAAPGADMRAATLSGGSDKVRGTSFAAPLVAGRLFLRGSREALNVEADRSGKPPVICGRCRNND